MSYACAHKCIQYIPHCIMVVSTCQLWCSTLCNVIRVDKHIYVLYNNVIVHL